MIVCLRTVGVPAEERRLRRFAGAAPIRLAWTRTPVRIGLVGRMA